MTAPHAILIVGATSAMAQEAGKLWAAQGARLVLAARNPEKLAAVAETLRGLGAVAVETLELDASDPSVMYYLVVRAVDAIGPLDAVLIAHGSLSDETQARRDPVYLASEIAVNLTSVSVVAEAAAAYFEQRGVGSVAVIGSVAGDRGKRRNYLYGMTKGALEIQMQGLRARFAGTPIRAVLIKPGPTDTPMTATHRKSALFSSAALVGAGIVRAVAGGPQIVYAPWWWRWIMGILKRLPEAIFIRLNL